MRKLLAALIILFAFPGFVFSQTFSNPPCAIAPANTDTGLITPYFGDSMLCIEQGLPYTATLQVSMPAVFNTLVELDSLVITSVTGLPAGISYRQNPSSGIYYADSNGCFAFEGTTNADSGAYPLTFNGYAVVTTQNEGTQTLSFAQLAELQDSPVPYFQFNVIYPGDSCVPRSVAGITPVIPVSELVIYPNPSSGIFNVDIDADKVLNGKLQVLDLTGRVVLMQNLNTAGYYKTTIDMTSYARGLYLLQIKTMAGTVSKRIAFQ